MYRQRLEDWCETHLATFRDLSSVFCGMGIILKVLMFRKMRTKSGAITVLVTGWKIFKKWINIDSNIFMGLFLNLYVPDIRQLNARVNDCSSKYHRKAKWRWPWGCWGWLRGLRLDKHSGAQVSCARSWRYGNCICEPNRLPLKNKNLKC